MLLSRLLRRRRSVPVRDRAADDYVSSRALGDALCSVSAGGEALRILRLNEGWLYRPVVLPITSDRYTLRDLHQIYFAPQKYDLVYSDAFAERLSAARAPVVEDVFVLGAGQGYWHFMMDFLPRLYFMAVIPEWRDYGLLIDANASDKERDTISQVAARVGMPAPRLVPVEPDIQRFANALCPGRIDRVSAAAVWDEALYPPHERPTRGIERLFVTRTASTRRLINQDEIAGLLEPLGFTCIEPGALSFEEQVATFAGASIIVGVHGSALTNILFAPPGATVVELYTTIPQPFYPALAAAKGLRHVSLAGMPAGEPRSHNDDFSIDTRLLLDLLKQLGVQ